MRNLKKYLSVLLVVAIMATSMVPVFAAETYSYSAEAQKLNTLGLYSGISTTSFDPDLGTALDRETGIVMLLRIFGLEATAKAMSDADAAAALAAYTDAKDVSEWALKSVAYAVKNGLVAGTTTTTIGAKEALSGDAYATLVLRQLGYTVGPNDYSNATYILADKGGLSITEAIKFDNKDLIKDDLVGITFASLDAKDTAGTTVLTSLLADGVVTVANAVYAGVYAAPATPTPTATPTPVPFGVESVTAVDLDTIMVKFTQAVEKVSAEDELNYILNNTLGQNADLSTVGTWTGTPIAELQSDGVTVKLSLNTLDNSATGNILANQLTNKLTVKSVKSVDLSKTVTTVTNNVIFADTTAPTVTAIETLGNSIVKVTFSESVTEATAENTANYKLNGSVLSTYSNSIVYNEKTNVATITMSNALANGEYTLAVSQNNAIVDLAGLKLLSSSQTFSLTKDETVGRLNEIVVAADKSNIVLKFSKPLKTAGYTTGAPILIDGIDIVSSANVAKAVQADGTLKLTTAGDGSTFNSLITVGAHVVRILQDTNNYLLDAYGVKYENNTSATYTVVNDGQKPVATTAVKKSATTTEITFSEAVTSASATVTTNYVLKDSAGSQKNVTGVAMKAGYNTIYVLTHESLTPGTFTVEVSNVKDIDNNTMDTVTLTYVVTDSTAPVASAAYFNGLEITVVFDSEMDTSTLVVDNFRYKNAAIPAGSSFAINAGNRSVKITLPAGTTAPTGADTVQISSALKDTAGNAIAGFGQTITLTALAAAAPLDVVAGSVKATARDTIEFKLDSHLMAYAADDFEVSVDGGASWTTCTPVGAYYTNSTSVLQSTVVVKLPTNAIPYDATTTLIRAKQAYAYATKSIANTTLANNIVNAAGLAPLDKIAPALEDTANNPVVTFDADGNGKLDHVIVTYKEAINPIYVNPLTYTVSGYTVTAANTDSGASLAAVKATLAAAATAGNNAAGKYVVLVLTQKDYNDGTALPAVTQALTVKDVAGNSLAAQTAVSAKDNAGPAISAIALTDAAGVAADWDGIGDVITLTFTENVSLAAVDADGALAGLQVTQADLQTILGNATPVYNAASKVTAVVSGNTIKFTISGAALTTGLVDNQTAPGSATALVKDAAATPNNQIVYVPVAPAVPATL